MSDRTCLFCAHTFTGGDRRRKFCWDCLPPHSADPKAYMARYVFLHAACMGGKAEYAQCSIAHLHPKPPTAPKPAMHGPPAPKRCAQCGEATWRPKHCSRLCSRRAAESTERAKELKRIRKKRELERRKEKRRDAPKRDWYCLDCGCPIPSRQIRCTPHRMENAQRRIAEYRIKSNAIRDGNAKYRARKRGATVERVDRTKVYKRDKWICQICYEPVDPTLRFPDPGSPELDHIIPISLGGPHSYKNTQLAHRFCNQSKSDRYDGYVQLNLLAVA